MTTLIAIFISSLVISLLLTPIVSRGAIKLGLVDIPTERKVHGGPIPRVGGLAIFLSFYLSIIISVLLYRTHILELVLQEQRIFSIVLGSFVIFGLGLWDDIRGLGPKTKLLFQIAAAIIVYIGGIRIEIVGIPWTSALRMGVLSAPVTIFWILLVVNAINLIDGLDGLAAGVCFFVFIILITLSVIEEEFLVALGMAAAAGSTLGFLKYNFNPATIFMGDSGSYFLGYLLAVLSILGSLKSHAALTILIPMIALGVPLMDAIWATIRRFALGKKILRADDDHFHHRLLKLGFTHRRAVLILYGATIGFGVIALVMIHTTNERAALLLLLVGAAFILGIRKLGYFRHMGKNALYGWFKDLGDETGLSRGRRSFLNLQVRIAGSQTYEELWKNIVPALEMLEFDIAAIYLNIRGKRDRFGDDSAQTDNRDYADKKSAAWLKATVGMRKEPPDWLWFREPPEVREKICTRCLLRFETHLLDADGGNHGVMLVLKDLERGDVGHFTLKRMEHLRRAIIRVLERLRSTDYADYAD